MKPVTGNMSQRLRFITGAHMVPDRRKNRSKFPLGEDAYFVVGDRAFGVADGVGSWAEKNIDAGMFSRELMRRASRFFETDKAVVDPVAAMVYAEGYAKAHKGSCTFCTLSIDGSNLRSAMLGDSGFVVLRRDIVEPNAIDAPNPRRIKVCAQDDCLMNSRLPGGGWKVVYKSQEQQHAFNTPYQIGSETTGVTSRNAVSMSIPLRQGDIVVCGTDGLFDNLFINDVCQLVGRYLETSNGVKSCRSTSDAEQLAQVTKLAEFITHSAVAASLHPGKRSPFSTQCVKAGYAAHGGKGDDITSVVAVVACARNTS